MANFEESGSTVGTVIGGNLAEIRRARGLRQEDVARLVNEVTALQWTRSVIAFIESGRRALEVSELVGLCLALEVTTTDLLAGGRQKTVTFGGDPAGRAGVSLPVLRKVLGGELVPWTPPLSKAAIEALMQSGAETAHRRHTEAEQKAAKSLKVDPSLLADAAQAKWGRSLTAERDSRVLDAPDDRDLRAVRGWVTRALLDELAPDLESMKEQP